MPDIYCELCRGSDARGFDLADSGLEKSYSAAGFGSSLGRGTTRAFLLVDLTLAYLDEESPLFAGRHGACVAAANAKLLQTARHSRLPIIHTRIEIHSGEEAGLFIKKVPTLTVFAEGGRFAAAPDSLQPNPGEVVLKKQYASGFFGTELAAMLTAMGVDAVVIGGASTSGCVRATALDAMQHGFIPLVVREACLDRDFRPHDSALFDLNEKYAEVIGLAEAQQLLRNPVDERQSI